MPAVEDDYGSERDAVGITSRRTPGIAKRPDAAGARSTDGFAAATDGRGPSLRGAQDSTAIDAGFATAMGSTTGAASTTGAGGSE